jgi:ABC-type transport system substrate-binding protein/chitodextrinase
VIGILVTAVAAAADVRPPAPAADDPTLVVGGQDEMKSRNLLPTIAADPWTRDVLERVYDTVLKIEGAPEVVLPYIAKGVDADGDGLFQASEYGRFWRDPVDFQGNPCDATAGTAYCALNVTVYYDFNGVYFHDGAQADAWDLLFSYHLLALNPDRNPDLRVLMDAGFASTRRTSIGIVSLDGSDWALPLPANASATLRASLRLTLNEPFALFAEATLNPLLLPRHVWERTGQRGDPAAVVDIHADFGCMVYPATASGGYVDTTKAGTGIPPGAADLPAGCVGAFDYTAAEMWSPVDADVIGSGPFRFETWVMGSHTQVLRNDAYYVGRNPLNPAEFFDSSLTAYLKLPTIGAILFKIYRSTTLGVLALDRGEIDYYHWSLPVEFVRDLLANPNIAVEIRPDLGFTYLGHNLRRVPFGYNASGGDVGLPYRQAVSHLVDRTAIVRDLLQNFGEEAYSTMAPALAYWHDASVARPAFDRSLAASILDAAGWGPDGPGDCSQSTPSGCRSLPGIGTRVTEILTPQADYDPVRAVAGLMIADSMRSVGLNFVSTPLAFGQIVARTDARDFDAYILDFRPDGTDPDYLFDLFHSTNAPAGGNIAGYNSPGFDQIIEDSRRELYRDQRRLFIHGAQQDILASRPYEPLYHRTKIEGYRQDRFVNWTVSTDTIWNYWSLLRIHPPAPVAGRLLITAPSAVPSGSTTAITAMVLVDRVPLADADVLFTLPIPLGSLDAGAGPGPLVNGTTDASGTVTVDYLAPTLLPGSSPRLELLTVQASHPALPDKPRKTAMLAVFAPQEPFLAVTVGLPEGDVVSGGRSIPAMLRVTDENGTEVPDAYVTVTANGPELSPTPSSGLAVDLGAVMLYASPSVTADTWVRVDVTATYAGWADAETVFQILVRPPEPDFPPVAAIAVEPGPSAFLDTVFVFNASGSSDPEGLPLSYAWDFGDGGSATGLVASHTYSARAAYTVTLTVVDAGGQATTNTTTVTVLNRAPVADAGVDATVFKRELVTLNGSASSDIDGDTLTYLWRQVSGPPASLGANGSVLASFTPLAAGEYVFEIRVSDGDDLASDTVNVTVPERPPALTATDPPGNVTMTSGETGRFTAEASDPDADPLAYRWLVDGVEVHTGATFDFQRPPGTYTLRVEVSDGSLQDAMEWTVTIRPPFPWWAVGIGLVGLVAATLALLFIRRRRRKPIAEDGEP